MSNFESSVYENLVPITYGELIFKEKILQIDSENTSILHNEQTLYFKVNKNYNGQLCNCSNHSRFVCIYK